MLDRKVLSQKILKHLIDKFLLIDLISLNNKVRPKRILSKRKENIVEM